MRTLLIAIFLITASSAQAWNGTGHMIVAYIAYNNLNANTRARVDVLLQLNPMYKQWIVGVPDNQKGLAIDFQLIGTKVDTTQEITPSLTAS